MATSSSRDRSSQNLYRSSSSSQEAGPDITHLSGPTSLGSASYQGVPLGPGLVVPYGHLPILEELHDDGDDAGPHPHGDELVDGDGRVEPVEGPLPIDGGHDHGGGAGGVQQVEDPVNHHHHQVLCARAFSPGKLVYMDLFIDVLYDPFS